MPNDMCKIIYEVPNILWCCKEIWDKKSSGKNDTNDRSIDIWSRCAYKGCKTTVERNYEDRGKFKWKHSELQVGVKILLDQQNERSTTCADKVKIREYEPVLIIKPKDESQGTRKTIEEIKEKIDPITVNISDVKSAGEVDITIDYKGIVELSKVQKL